MYIIKTRGFPEEHKKRLNEPHKGKQTSEESKSTMSETAKDKMDNDGCRESPNKPCLISLSKYDYFSDGFS